MSKVKIVWDFPFSDVGIFVLIYDSLEWLFEKVFIFEKCNSCVAWNVFVTFISFNSFLPVCTRGKKRTNVKPQGM